MPNADFERCGHASVGLIVDGGCGLPVRGGGHATRRHSGWVVWHPDCCPECQSIMRTATSTPGGSPKSLST